MTGSERRRGRPERLGEVLQEVLAGTGMDERIAEASVVPEWDRRVGPAIAAVTTPLRVSQGTLFVAVRSSAWLMELQMMERTIRQALNEGRERGRIRRIRFVMGTGERPETRRDQRS